MAMPLEMVTALLPISEREAIAKETARLIAEERNASRLTGFVKVGTAKIRRSSITWISKGTEDEILVEGVGFTNWVFRPSSSSYADALALYESIEAKAINPPPAEALPS